MCYVSVDHFTAENKRQEKDVDFNNRIITAITAIIFIKLYLCTDSWPAITYAGENEQGGKCINNKNKNGVIKKCQDKVR